MTAAAPTDLFDQVLELPDPLGVGAYDSLVGVDAEKAALTKEAQVRLDPGRLRHWAATHHADGFEAEELVLGRPSLFLLGGDVGSGKTTLARGFASAIARDSEMRISLFSLSLAARGSGAVGEMTRLITEAFAHVRRHSESSADRARGKKRPAVLLIDEADSLAQSRAESQMHHEDRAGVNALIRGIDELAHRRLPVVVVMCTNRLTSIDPAVQRRAAAVLQLSRPDAAQITAMLKRLLQGAGLSEADVIDVARALAGGKGKTVGCTHSDVVQRYVPALVLDAFPDAPIVAQRALELARTFRPTPPFVEPAA